MFNAGVIFPGQGSQRRGMGIDFRDKFPEAEQVFRTASEALSLDIGQICRDEDPRLDLTEFTQPCILTAEIAMFESLKAHFAFEPQVFAGHSLGEYTALVAAGAIPFETAIRLVHSRGKLMQWSVAPGSGSMAAVIMENEKLPLDEIGAVAADFTVDIANDNSITQVVLSGDSSNLERLCAALRKRYEATSIRIVPLSVSAPFHSRHMIEIEEKFRNILEACKHRFSPAQARQVTSNFTGDFHTGSLEDLIDSLTRQMSGRVRWRDNMEAVRNRAGTLYELGPNRPLSGFFKTLGVSVQSILDLRTAQRALLVQKPAQKAVAQ